MISEIKENEYNYIVRCLRWLANNIAPEYVNNSLNPSLMKKMDNFYHSLESVISWNNLTKEDCMALGCICYDDPDCPYETWFFPAWLYPLIPEGLSVIDNEGKEVIFHRKDIPFTLFYGNLTFGLRFPNN